MRQKKKSADSGELLDFDRDAKPWLNIENHQDLLSSFQDAYLDYKRIANRRILEMRPRKGPGAGGQLVGADEGEPQTQTEEQDFRDFYLAPNIPQLREPDKQIKYREAYIEEVGARPEPDQMTLLADTLHLEQLETVKDRSDPVQTRKDLSAFFRRYAVTLQHRKHKMLARWANQAKNAI